MKLDPKLIQQLEIRVSRLEASEQNSYHAFRKAYPGDEYLWLAAHASFPLALTTDLLYKIWLNFLKEEPKHKTEKRETTSSRSLDPELHRRLIMVSDLLHSPLCEEVGLGIFVIKENIRESLLELIYEDPKLGEGRILDLANFLKDYLKYNAEKLPTQSFFEAQNFRAISELDPNSAAEIIINAAIQEHKNEVSTKKVDYLLRLSRKASNTHHRGIQAGNLNQSLEIAEKFSEGLRAFKDKNLQKALENFRAFESRIELDQGESKGIQAQIPLEVWEGLKPDMEGRKKDEGLSQVESRANIVYSLFVGINAYAELPHLSGAVLDVINLFKAIDNNLLTNVRHDSNVLLNKKATKTNIVNAIFEIAKVIDSGDTFFFYFAGLGGKETAGEEWWSIEPDKLLEVIYCYDSSAQGSGESLPISDKELTYLLGMFKGKGCDVVTMFDTSFDTIGNKASTEVLSLGTSRTMPYVFPERSWKDFIFSEEWPDDPNSLKNLLEQQIISEQVEIVASRTGFYAWETNEGGVFTQLVIETLRQQKGEVSYLGLMDWVQLKIQQKFPDTFALYQIPSISSSNILQDLLYQKFLRKEKLEREDWTQALPFDSEERQGNFFALLVGIDSYESEDFSDLQFCEADVLRWNSFLESNYINEEGSNGRVRQLLGKQATRGAILRTLKDLISFLEPGDVFFFSFSGYGYSEILPSAFLNWSDFDKGLICYDTSLTDPGKAGISLVELHAFLHEISKNGVRSTLVLDSSFTSKLEYPRTLNAYYDGYYIDRAVDFRIPMPFANYVIYEATGRGEEARENNGGGIFTTSMLEVLSRNPQQSYSNVFADVRAETQRLTERDQNPSWRTFGRMNPYSVFLTAEASQDVFYPALRNINGQWLVEFGILDGLQFSELESAHREYPVFLQRNPAKPIGYARLGDIGVDYSSLIIDNFRIYPNQLNGIAIQGNPFRIAINGVLPSQLRDFVRAEAENWLVVVDEAEYEIRIGEDKIRIYQQRVGNASNDASSLASNDERLISGVQRMVDISPNYDIDIHQKSFETLLSHMKKIVQWERLRNLQSPTNGSLKREDVVLFFQNQKTGNVNKFDFGEINPSAIPKVYLEIEQEDNDELATLPFQLSAMLSESSLEGSECYYYLFYLSASYGIDLAPAFKGNANFEAGEEFVLLDRGQFAIEDKSVDQIEESFILFLSREPIANIKAMEQAEFSRDEWGKVVDVSNDSYRDEYTRSLAKGFQSFPRKDWTMVRLDVRLSKKKEAYSRSDLLISQNVLQGPSYRDFQRELLKTGFILNNPINAILQVGMYGVAEEGVFRPIGNILDLGLEFELREEVSDTYGLRSNGENYEEEGLWAIKFEKEFGHYFFTTSNRFNSIGAMASLERDLIDLERKKIWNPNWYVVNQVLHVEKGMLILANTQNFSTAKITSRIPNEKEVTLGSLRNRIAELEIVEQIGIDLIYIWDQPHTPLFKLSKLKRRFLRGYQLVSEPENFPR